MAETNEKVTVNADRTKYQASRSAAGKKSLNNGDPVAEVLDGLSLDAVHALGKKLLKEDTAEKYQHLNDGMQRMNVGNRLRKFVKSGEEGEDNLGQLQDAAAPFHTKAEKERAATEKKKAAEKAAKEKEAKAKAKEKGKKAA